jgi:hypothetical protein
MTVFLSYRWCNWSRRYGGNGFLRAIAFAAEELHGRLAGDTTGLHHFVDLRVRELAFYRFSPVNYVVNN